MILKFEVLIDYKDPNFSNAFNHGMASSRTYREVKDDLARDISKGILEHYNPHIQQVLVINKQDEQ
jgi:hypothetical protein